MMTIMNTSSIRRRLALSVGALLLLAGCHWTVTDGLLRAPDPDLINPADINNADGANGLRLGALSRLRDMTAGTESSWLFGGLLADEWSTSSTFIQNDEADERTITLSNSSVTAQFRTIMRARTAANQAIASLNTFAPTPSSNVAEMYLVRGFAELQAASDFCNGIPLTDASKPVIVYGQPLTVLQVFTIASASLDTAISLSSATDAKTYWNAVLVLAQAMACGCPVIASENSGGPDLIRDGVNGLIIPAAQSRNQGPGLPFTAVFSTAVSRSRSRNDRAESNQCHVARPPHHSRRPPETERPPRCRPVVHWTQRLRQKHRAHDGRRFE